MLHKTLNFRPQIGIFQSLTPACVDSRTVLVHDVVVLYQILTNVKIMSLNLLLSTLDRTGNNAVLDRRFLIQPQSVHEATNPLPSKNTHQIVFQRYIKLTGASISLAPTTSTKLIIN